MKKISFVEWSAFMLVSVQIALYAFMWFRLLADPCLKTMDFISFYAVGRLARAGEYKQLYDFNDQAVIQRQVVGVEGYSPLIFNHPLHIVPLLAVVSGADYVRAFILWTVARLLILVILAELIRQYLLRKGWDARSAWLGMLGCISFFPVTVSLLDGQDTIFTMGGLLVWMLALINKKDMAAGLGLAFATLSPTIAGALALPMFLSRRRASVWFFAGIMAIVVYSFLLVGAHGIRDFLNMLLISSQGLYYGFDWSKMYNLTGLLMRDLPGLEISTARAIAWSAAFLSIVFMCVLWWIKRDHLRIEFIGIAAVLGTFTAPHLNLHGLSYLLLPILCLISILWDRGYKKYALLLTPAISMVLILVIFLKSTWNFAAYYVLMSILVYGLCANAARSRPSIIADAVSAIHIPIKVHES